MRGNSGAARQSSPGSHRREVRTDSTSSGRSSGSNRVKVRFDRRSRGCRSRSRREAVKVRLDSGGTGTLDGRAGAHTGEVVTNPGTSLARRASGNRGQIVLNASASRDGAAGAKCIQVSADALGSLACRCSTKKWDEMLDSEW